MPTFAFSGRTRGGETINGERVADTADAAVAALRREQVMVTRIAATKEKAAAAGAAKKGKLGKKVDPKNLAVFTRQFSVMIDAGLPLVQCLEILGTQEEDKNFAETILATRSDVEGGASLADAMKKHPKTFDPLFSNMIAAGEAGGILDTILKRLATYIEKAVKLKSQVKSAMIYPIAVIVIAVLVVGVILWKVIPDICGAVLRSRRGAAAPDPHRHRPQRLPRRLHAVHHRRHCRHRLGLQDVLRDRRRQTSDRRHHAEAARAGPHHAEDRRRALLPHARPRC